MIVLDTCALIFDALSPEKLTSPAKKAIDKAERQNQIFCSDISLWEIGMLIQKKRLQPGIEARKFMQLVLAARNIQVLPITVEIADIATAHSGFNHYDPADRLIAATAIYHHVPLITADQQFAKVPQLSVVW